MGTSCPGTIKVDRLAGGRNISHCALQFSVCPLEIKEVLKRHTPRIRELSFTEISSATFSLLLGDTKPSSLRLRSLCLQSPAQEKKPCFSMGNLMNSEILQNLDVERVDVDWFRLPLTSLVSLKIHDPPNRPSWTDFVTALQAMPALEILDLEDSLPVASEVRRRPFNPVGLTRLRKLSLYSWTGINEVLNVLSFIVVRQTTMLNLGGVHVYRQIPINPVPPNLAPSLSAFLSEMRSEHYEKLFYQTLRVFCTPAMLDLMAWGEGCENGVFPDDPVNLTLTIYFHHTSSDAGAKGLQGIIPVLPVVKLVTLVLNIDVTVEQNFLVATFGNLPQLRNVSITGTGTNNFLLALLHKPDNYNTCASAYYSTSFPALRSIAFSGVIFTPDTASHLEDCLMERWERNAEIRKLIFSDCSSLYTYDVQRLREIVVNVDWDGLEHEYQSDDDDDNDDNDDDGDDD